MISYAANCPACHEDARFVPRESQVYAESLLELKAHPFADPRHPGAEDHELYGYCMTSCPHCGADVIVHFNVVLHRYLALLQTLLPGPYAQGEDRSAHELFERLEGDLRSFSLNPLADALEM